MMTLAGGAFLSGLAGSPHCVGMCGPFASIGPGIPWHIGRLTTYAVLGAIAGAAGAIIPGPAWVPAAFAGVMLFWFALRFAGLLPRWEVPVPALYRLGARFRGQRGWTGRFLLGLVTGLLPCGLVYSALALPIASGSALSGAVTMVVFGLGTVPALGAARAVLQRLELARPWVRRGIALVVLLVGVWSISTRVEVTPQRSCHEQAG